MVILCTLRVYHKGTADLAIHHHRIKQCRFLRHGKDPRQQAGFSRGGKQPRTFIISFTTKTPGLSTARLFMPPQNIHCLTVIPHPPGPCSALRNFPWRACYHAYGSCEAILPLRSLVLADKTLPPWQVCQRASACSAICNSSSINNCIVWIARAHLQKRMSIYVVLAMGCWSLVLFDYLRQKNTGTMCEHRGLSYVICKYTPISDLQKLNCL